MTSAELLDAAMPEAILSYMSQLIPLIVCLGLSVTWNTESDLRTPIHSIFLSPLPSKKTHHVYSACCSYQRIHLANKLKMSQ